MPSSLLLTPRCTSCFSCSLPSNKLKISAQIHSSRSYLNSAQMRSSKEDIRQHLKFCPQASATLSPPQHKLSTSKPLTYFSSKSSNFLSGYLYKKLKRAQPGTRLLPLCTKRTYLPSLFLLVLLLLLLPLLLSSSAFGSQIVVDLRLQKL